MGPPLGATGARTAVPGAPGWGQSPEVVWAGVNVSGLQ